MRVDARSAKKINEVVRRATLSRCTDYATALDRAGLASHPRKTAAERAGALASAAYTLSTTSPPTILGKGKTPLDMLNAVVKILEELAKIELVNGKHASE